MFAKNFVSEHPKGAGRRASVPDITKLISKKKYLTV